MVSACPGCGHINFVFSERCTGCGRVLHAAPSPGLSWRNRLFVAGLCLALVLVAAGGLWLLAARTLPALAPLLGR